MSVGPISAWPALAGQGLGLPASLLLLVPAWPLALAALALLPPLRGIAVRLAPWAALPALLIAALAPAAVLPLPGLLLGASLTLDSAGRWLLGAVALLWLAGGGLAAGRLPGPRHLLAFLLAMAGALWLPLAADVPSMAAASVLAAYPLYGWLGGARGARVLLVSVVIGDLLIFEAVVLLAKGAAGLEAGALRVALTEVPGGGLVLALLLVGFGAKAGLMGLHYWLAPTMTEARSSQTAAVVAFLLAAGLLPWLRLLPFGEVHWPGAAGLLSWLALAGCGWAVLAGLLQGSPRALWAYTWSGLASWWLGLLGLGLEAPAPPPGATGLLPAALALSGLGVAALLLAGGAAQRHGRLAGWGLALLAALAVALAVLSAVAPAVAGGGVLRWPGVGALVCVGLLLGASVTTAATAPPTGRGREHGAAAVLVAGALVMALQAVASVSWSDRPPADAWLGAGLIATALLGGLVVGLVAAAALARVPRVPPGDLLGVLERAAGGLVVGWNRLGAVLGHGRDRLLAAVAGARPQWGRGAVATGEARLRRWSTAMVLLLAAGAAIALLAHIE